MTTQDDFDLRYYALGHAIQSGIAYLMEKDKKLVDPKHLRVGINTAHVTDHAIAELLIAKGVFTEDEYRAQLLVSMEKEVRKLEAEISELNGGVKVTLG